MNGSSDGAVSRSMLNRHISIEKLIEIAVITIFQIGLAVFLTLYVNYRISNIQNKLNVELREKQKMEETSSQFLTLSHERLFLMNRLIGFYKYPYNSDDKGKFRNEYLDAVKSWNISRGTLESNIKLYFGAEDLKTYQEKVDKEFRGIHEKLNGLSNKVDVTNGKSQVSDFQIIEPEIVRLTQSIYELDKSMQAKIQTVIKQN